MQCNYTWRQQFFYTEKIELHQVGLEQVILCTAYQLNYQGCSAGQVEPSNVIQYKVRFMHIPTALNCLYPQHVAAPKPFIYPQPPSQFLPFLPSLFCSSLWVSYILQRCEWGTGSSIVLVAVHVQHLFATHWQHATQDTLLQVHGHTQQNMVSQQQGRYTLHTCNRTYVQHFWNIKFRAGNFLLYTYYTPNFSLLCPRFCPSHSKREPETSWCSTCMQSKKHR